MEKPLWHDKNRYQIIYLKSEPYFINKVQMDSSFLY